MSTKPSIKLIERVGDDDGWVFDVVIKQGRKQTEHTVSIQKSYWKKITGGATKPSQLLERSILFLLERESNDEILPSFDLSDIQKYFPEYEEEIAKN